MARAALAAGARVDLLHLEAGLPQPRGKAPVGMRRPDGEHAAGLQRGTRGGQPRQAVKTDRSRHATTRRGRCRRRAGSRHRRPCPIRSDRRRRPRAPRPADRRGCRRKFPPSARAPRRRPTARVRRRRPLRPTKSGKGCAQRKAHAEPANQHVCAAPAADAGASQLGERLFRTAQAAVHQLVGAEHDGEFAAAPLEAQFLAAARNLRRIKLYPGDHVRTTCPIA